MGTRLEAVKDFLQLSLDNEKQLTDLVFLASQICEIPIASITLVDNEKQYPVIGVGKLIGSSCDIAFCNHTIKQQTILEVPDASRDPRFVNNPLVTGDPYIRFYAGVPLITTAGFTIGSFCVVDQNPKKLTDNQIKSLEILSKQAMHHLEVIHTIRILKETVDDVEQNKELLEQAEVMKTAFYDGSEDYFLLLNTSFEIVSYNSSFEKFLNKRLNTLELKKGKKIFEYLIPQNVIIVEQLLKKAKEGESSSFELLAYANEQNESWNKFTLSPTYNRNKDLIGIACIGCNIDKDKRQEEKIKLQNFTLTRIASLHSHEIRHPLTNILSVINILKHEDTTINQQFLGFLETSANELDAVIKKIVLGSHNAKETSES